MTQSDKYTSHVKLCIQFQNAKEIKRYWLNVINQAEVKLWNWYLISTHIFICVCVCVIFLIHFFYPDTLLR